MRLFSFKTTVRPTALVIVAAVVAVVVVTAFGIVGVEAFLVLLLQLLPSQIVLVADGVVLPRVSPEKIRIIGRLDWMNPNWFRCFIACLFCCTGIDEGGFEG
jgi:hypothetical protein